MPEPVRTTESADSDEVPVTASRPPLPIELKQPSPEPRMLLLPHGQAVPLPSPKQNAWLTGPTGPPGTFTFTLMSAGTPGFHRPSVATPATGAASASKRKL